ncbi:MAG: SBBP repeat-containing protein [Candidatus Limnocylindria bacterium]
MSRLLVTFVAFALVLQQIPAPGAVVRLDGFGSLVTDALPAESVTAPSLQAPAIPSAPAPASVSTAYAGLPLAFEPDLGQAGGAFDFVARGRGYTFGIAPSGAVLALRAQDAPAAAGDDLVAGAIAAHAADRTALVRLELSGARPDARPAGLDELPGTVNYFIGNDPAKWRTGIPTYARVRYESVYPGIDVVYYGNQRELEFDLVVAPGADPRAVAIDVRGAERLALQRGEVVIGLAGGELLLRPPHVYQDLDGGRRAIGARYLLLGGHRIGVEVDAYDANAALVIDPIVSYSTYLGGGGQDFGFAVAVDRLGNAYVTGTTDSTNFPTTDGALDPIGTETVDVFVSKIDASGTALLWSTYLGGSGFDSGHGIAVDLDGNVYLTGDTGSGDFPTTEGAYDTTCGTDGTCDGALTDGFATKLTSDGSALAYSTYLGGSEADNGTAIAVDGSGNAHVTGYTFSVDFPTTAEAFQSLHGGAGSDAFVTKLSATGTGLVYSTFLGGSGPPPEDTSLTLGDLGRGIAVDATGNAYVTGSTDSPDFPTTEGAFQSIHGSEVNADPSGFFDAFVTKLSPTGGAIYSTFLGEDRTDHGVNIAVDPLGQAYITGATASFAFPMANAFQGEYNFGSDAFLTKLNAAGTAVLYSTYLGGSPQTGNTGFDGANGVAVDARGFATIVGRTDSTDFPTVDPLQAANGGSFDAFVSKFDTKASGAGSLVFSTYLGGSGADEGIEIARDPFGNLYAAGFTDSTNFPTVGAIQPASGGSTDAFVVKLTEHVLYGVESGTDGLSRIDPVTGEATFIGRLDPDETKFTTPIAMAVRPSDRAIFVWNNSDGNSNETLVSTGVLLTVDSCTGRGTPVNPDAEPQGFAGALAFSPGGTLYALAGADLYSVSTTTGARTLIGPNDLGLSVSAADFDPVSGLLYGLEFTSPLSETAPRLVTIDPENGAGTVVATLSVDVGRAQSLVFTPGTGQLIGSAFGGTPGDVLFDIDKATGAVSNVRTVTGSGGLPQGMGFSGPCEDDEAPPVPQGVIEGIARCRFEEPALPNISVELWQGRTLLASTTSNGDGFFSFTGVGDGEYFLIFRKDDGSECGVSVTVSGGETTFGEAQTCEGSNTWPTAEVLPADGTVKLGRICEPGGRRWYKIDGVPALSRIVARLTGTNGGPLPADYTLILFRDIAAALQPVENTADAHIQFGGDTFGGDTFGGDTFGGDTFGGDTFGGDTFGGDTFGGDTFGGDTFGGDTFGGDTFGGDTFGGDTFGGDTFGGDTFGGDTFGDLYALNLPPEAFAAAISRSVVRVAAHKGTLQEGLWQNTWNNSGTWYLRVSGYRGAFSPEPFEISSRVFSGACAGVDPTLGVSSLAVPPATTTGAYQTLILTHSGRYGAEVTETSPITPTSVLKALQDYAAHSTVNGYVADFATDTALVAAYAQWDDPAKTICPFAANVVANGIRGYVHAFKQAHPTVTNVLIAASDEAVPLYRVPDYASLAKQSLLVVPLKPQAVESGLRLDFFGTDDAYVDLHPVLKTDHELFVPKVGVGRLTEPKYIPNMVSAYLEIGGLLTPETFTILGYNFWNDVAGAISQQAVEMGKTVPSTLPSGHPYIQSGQGLPTDLDAWTGDDLLDAFASDPDVFVAFMHGIRARQLLAANYDLVPAQQVIDLSADSTLLRGKLILSGACNYNFNVPAGQAIFEETPDPELSEIGQAFGATTVAWAAYAYGDDERIAYSEELLNDLVREWRYGTGPVVLGHAMARVKRDWVSRTTDLKGIHQKSVMSMSILGFPTLQIDVGTTGRLTRPSDLAAFGTAALTPVPAETAGSSPALNLRTKDLALDFSGANGGPDLVRVDRQLANVDALGNLTGTFTTASYYEVQTSPTEPGGVQVNPLEPITPRHSVPVRPNDLGTTDTTFARGAVFLGGSYTLEEGFVPLVSVPAYQLAPTGGSFITDHFFPNDTYEINYLAHGATCGCPTLFDEDREFLLVRPAQYRSAVNATTGQPEIFGTERTFQSMDFRLYYSSLLLQNVTGTDFQAILAGPPEILGHTATPSGGNVDFEVFVSGLPQLGIQSVVVTWTNTNLGGGTTGTFQPLFLTQDPTETRRWTGSLAIPAGAAASDIRYMLSVVNGAGRVRVADNFGNLYTPETPPTLIEPMVDTTLTFDVASTPTTAISGRSVTVAATLARSDTGAALQGKKIVFRLSGVLGDKTFAFTDADGKAAATLKVNVLPGELSVNAQFEGDEDFFGSSARSPISVAKETTNLTLDVTPSASPASQQYSDRITVTSRLTDGLGRRLREQPVFFLIKDAGGAVLQATSAETDFRGDATAEIQLLAPVGVYTVTAAFAGLIPLPAPEPALDLTNARYLPVRTDAELAVTQEDATATYTGETVEATGQPVALAGTITEAADGGIGDILTATGLFEVTDSSGNLVSFPATLAQTGEGTAEATASIDAGLAVGVYTVVLVVSGNYAGASEAVLLAIYDPEGGFVTGSGWIDSPPEAYTPDPTLTGKASFGFVSKYKKGATVPTGQTQFQFRVADLSFHSTAYEWLVVAGARAQYKGTGTINGSGNYGFMLTAVDGQVNGGGGVDKFRIKIWDKDNGDTTVYDNEVGKNEDSTPTTEIAGGSIVIRSN